MGTVPGRPGRLGQLDKALRQAWEKPTLHFVLGIWLSEIGEEQSGLSSSYSKAS